MKDSRLANEIVGLFANKAILRLDSAETARWQFYNLEIRKLSKEKSQQPLEQHLQRDLTNLKIKCNFELNS